MLSEQVKLNKINGNNGAPPELIHVFSLSQPCLRLSKAVKLCKLSLLQKIMADNIVNGVPGGLGRHFLHKKLEYRIK